MTILETVAPPPPARTVINTVGSKILFVWRKNHKRDPDALPSTQERTALIGELLARDPINDRDCGPEINSISSLIDRGIASHSNRLLFFHSDTDDGRFVGPLLCEYFHRRFDVAGLHESRPVPGLDHMRPEVFKRAGLGNLVGLVADAIWAARRPAGPSACIINATAGYKAQMAFCVLIGQALRAPVYYLFEAFPEIIDLPPMPIQFDSAEWVRNFTLFDRLSREDALLEAEVEALNPPPQIMTLVESAGGGDFPRTYHATPMGLLYHKAFSQQFLERRDELVLRQLRAAAPKDRLVEVPEILKDDPAVKRISDYLLGKPYVKRAKIAAVHEQPYERTSFALAKSMGGGEIRGSIAHPSLAIEAAIWLADGPRNRQIALIDLALMFPELARHPATESAPSPSDRATPAAATVLSIGRQETDSIEKRLAALLDRIPIRARRFAFGIDSDEATLPMLRGTWGAALHDLDAAAYAAVFEGRSAASSSLPAYLLRPSPPDCATASVDWIVWGAGLNHESALIRAWETAARRGLGSARRPFTILNVAALGPMMDGPPAQEIPLNHQPDAWTLGRASWPIKAHRASAPCRIIFESPLRLLRGGKLIAQPTYTDLVIAAWRRVEALAGAVQAEEMRTLRSEVIDIARAKPAVPWVGRSYDLRRYSAAQDRDLELRGVQGMLDLPEGPGEIWPLLAAAQWIHIGKGTVFGLGQPLIFPLGSA